MFIPMNEDLISRQAAIATAISGRVRTLPTTEDGENWIRVNEVRDSLLSLPSAQPERYVDCGNFNKTQLLIPQPEIVRCGECKHRDKRYLCKVWDAYITNDEYYCGNAERREE